MLLGVELYLYGDNTKQVCGSQSYRALSCLHMPKSYFCITMVAGTASVEAAMSTNPKYSQEKRRAGKPV